LLPAIGQAEIVTVPREVLTDHLRAWLGITPVAPPVTADAPTAIPSVVEESLSEEEEQDQ